MSKSTVAALVVAALVGGGTTVAVDRLLVPGAMASVDFGDLTNPSGGGREVLYWRAPMDPNFRRDEPGKSPMGMDLVPVYADEQNEAEDDPSVVRIKPSVVNNLGVRTSTVERRDLARTIETVGYLDFDESLISYLHVRADGWIEKLAVRSVGARVKRGQL